MRGLRTLLIIALIAWTVGGCSIWIFARAGVVYSGRPSDQGLLDGANAFGFVTLVGILVLVVALVRVSARIPPGGRVSVMVQAPAGSSCGRCGKPLSPAWWGKCEHCGAPYTEFPPVPREAS